MEDPDKTLEISSVTDRLMSLVLELPEEQQKSLLAKLESKLSKERRRHTRKTFITVVDFASQGRVYKEFAQNISDSGVYIETSESFSVGQEVVLTFSFQDAQKHVKIAGRIARVADTGIGVEFNMGDSLDDLAIKSLLKGSKHSNRT